MDFIMKELYLLLGISTVVFLLTGSVIGYFMGYFMGIRQTHKIYRKFNGYAQNEFIESIRNDIES
ncbi:hypothetical protein [uncultured Clostridium sp.]|uniref:hypothetical protein n=1 Tax=uncultured Clostridium sp. TaxID=59620 RepID=UPI0025EAB18A|nr:hypothetical protein [uncultured Clostridium sp.]